MTSTYTPLWDWVMERNDLTVAEKLVICRVLRWREGGCFESNRTIGRKTGLHPRTVQKVVKKLVHRQWLAHLPLTKRSRQIWVDPSRMTAGPLFEKIGTAAIKAITTHSLTARGRKKRTEAVVRYGQRAP